MSRTCERYSWRCCDCAVKLDWSGSGWWRWTARRCAPMRRWTPIARPPASTSKWPRCWRRPRRRMRSRIASSVRSTATNCRRLWCGGAIAWRGCGSARTSWAADAASLQQEKIAARTAMEKASGKRKRGRKPKPADPAVDPDRVANVTDPDSGIMKTRHSWLQGYNAQIVVTVGQIILAADVTTEANDVHQLTPMLNQARDNVAEVVSKDAVLGAAVADAGDWSG